MFTVVVKEKEEAVEDEPYAFGGLGAIALTPLTKILAGGALVVFLGMSATIGWLMFAKQGVELDLAKSENDKILLQTEIDNCKTKLDEQNAQIEQIKKDAEADIALFDSVNDQLNRVIEIQDREVGRLKDLPVPQSCEEAKKLLEDNLDLFRSITE